MKSMPDASRFVAGCNALVFLTCALASSLLYNYHAHAAAGAAAATPAAAAENGGIVCCLVQHNKKREELHRLQEKYPEQAAKLAKVGTGRHQTTRACLMPLMLRLHLHL
jgi:hypothetical protein